MASNEKKKRNGKGRRSWQGRNGRKKSSARVHQRTSSLSNSAQRNTNFHFPTRAAPHFSLFWRQLAARIQNLIIILLPARNLSFTRISISRTLGSHFRPKRTGQKKRTCPTTVAVAAAVTEAMAATEAIEVTETDTAVATAEGKFSSLKGSRSYVAICTNCGHALGAIPCASPIASCYTGPLLIYKSRISY